MGISGNVIEVWAQARQVWARFEGRAYPAIWGQNGAIEAAEKKEGDGKTPLGLFALRRVFYRADRLTRPQTRLPLTALAPDHGWCDAPDDPKYNQWVSLPYPAHAETLWREDRLYDIIIVIGFNDAPVRAGFGSAIFIHLTAEDGAPTKGCIALAPDDMRALLKSAGPETKIRIMSAHQK